MDDIQDVVNHIQRKPASVILPAALFFLLTPGNFVTIPGNVSLIEVTSLPPARTPIVVHGLIFGVALLALKKYWGKGK